MKYLICLLALCSIAHAQIMPSARRAVVVQPVAAPPVGPTPVFSESFEGTGYENNEWVELIGDFNEDSTEQAADGSQSLKSESGVSSQASCYSAWTAGSVTTNDFAMFYSATDVYVSLVRGYSNTTSIWNLINHSNGTFRAYHGSNYLSVALPSANQWVYIRLVYTAGSGTDGTLDFYVTTTPGSWGTPTSLSNGTSTLNQDGFYLRNDGAAMDMHLDDINVYTP